MSWEETLKISRKEATELGDKYAPEDMKEFRLEQSNKRKEREKEKKKLTLPVFRRFLDILNTDEAMDEKYWRKIRSSLIVLSNGIENAPRFRGKSREQIIETLEEYLGA